MDHFSPDDLRHVFFELYRAGWDAILIGGQAVNVWAARYQLKNAEWDKLRPFTSRDLDYYGGLFEARRAMQILNARGKLNTGMEPVQMLACSVSPFPEGNR